MKMKKGIPILAILAIFTGCGHKQHGKELSNETNTIKVKTQTVQTVTGNSIFRYSGTIEPSQTIPLTFQSSGLVKSVMVQEGDMVLKGEVLATVDNADNESMYNAAVAKYNQAKDAYDRLKNVHDKGSLPEIKWVEMEANLKQAESQLQLSKSSLEKCNLRSPGNGMIGHRNVEPGQSALTTTAPLELVKIETVLVKVAVPENEISKIKKGQKARLVVSALDDKTFEGEVSHVGVVADKISRTYEVKITVKNNNLEIKPGMVCDVLLDAGARHSVMVVSYSSVSKDEDGNTFVYKVTPDGKSVKKQTITIGNYNETGVEVLRGLSFGETIVVEGKEKLLDNSLISL
jgi:RND family efflux transporter MFP subunit